MGVAGVVNYSASWRRDFGFDSGFDSDYCAYYARDVCAGVWDRYRHYRYDRLDFDSDNY